MSSCLDPKKPAPVPQIVIGEDKTLGVQLTDATTKSGFDLSGATEIVAILLNADNTYLQLKLSLSQIVVINNPVGLMQIIVTAAQSALLALSPILIPGAGDVQPVYGYSNIELHITIASKVTIVQLPDSIQVVQTLFP